MKNSLIIMFLFLTGCSFKTNFKFNQNVKVVSGFYQGSQGYVRARVIPPFYEVKLTKNEEGYNIDPILVFLDEDNLK